MEIIFDGDRMPADNIVKQMQEAGSLVLEQEGVDNKDIEVSVTFVDMEEMRELNHLYRDMDKVTDVLSFPQFENAEEIPKNGPIILGDVVICTEEALLQADDLGHSPSRELVYLFTHSMFHLLGYDHETGEEKELMRRCEEGIMEQIGLKREGDSYV